MGLGMRYWPFLENAETETILLASRRPAWILDDGRLEGTQAEIYDSATIRVWTSRVLLARRIAAEYNLKIRLLNGECILDIPAALADGLLPRFGVKSRKRLTEEQRRLAAERFAKIKSERISEPQA